MIKEKSKIQCPNCKKEIDVNEILHHQVEEDFKKEYQLKLLSEKSKLEMSLRKQISEEKSEEIKSYRSQLNEKILEAKELNKLKADFEKLKREKEELKEAIEAESQQKITLIVNEERGKIQKSVEDKIQLKLAEREYVIDQLKKQLNEAQRKVEQGSMQIQGEVQEIEIEKFLKTNFPSDRIEEIKKGARGADCIQIVNTRSRQNCGSIYYESKRTKDFQTAWIEKFKLDMRAKGATFGVLVSDSLPKEMERFGQRSGIWICKFEEFKALCFVLRESVILLDNSMAAQENKGGKMELLYEYLTGNEFRMEVTSIVEGFTQMHQDLDREKRSMAGLWKKREKQLQMVLVNTTNMFNTVKGIAGNAIGTIKELELPETPDNT